MSTRGDDSPVSPLTLNKGTRVAAVFTAGRCSSDLIRGKAQWLRCCCSRSAAPSGPISAARQPAVAQRQVAQQRGSGRRREEGKQRLLHPVVRPLHSCFVILPFPRSRTLHSFLLPLASSHHSLNPHVSIRCHQTVLTHDLIRDKQENGAS